MIHYLNYFEDGTIHSMSSHGGDEVRVFLNPGPMKMQELVIANREHWDEFITHPENFVAKEVPGGVTFVPKVPMLNKDME